MNLHEPNPVSANVEFRVQRRVAFHETDAAGMVHFASYFIWMEQAEHAFLAHLGIHVFMDVLGERVSWPRVSAQCDFQKPLRFEDEFEIGVQVVHLGDSSVRYRFDLQRTDEKIAVGYTTAVCCRLDPHPTPMAIPADMRAALTHYLRRESG